MKKCFKNLVMLLVFMTITACVCVLNGNAAWDGLTITEPSRGTDGTYLIGTAEELAWFANYVNKVDGSINGRLTEDIVLNDYNFDFDEDSGLVKATDADGNVQFALGIGITGKKYHKSTAGEIGAIYSKLSLTSDSSGSCTLPNDIVSWTPIGNSITKFEGTFDGDGHTVSGLYINSSKDYQGLFGYANGGLISNVVVVNSYIKGNSSTGSICGYNGSGCSILNCYSTGVVSGISNIGGICGYIGSSCSMSNCYSTGIVSGSNNALGGICGLNEGGSISNCYIAGTVYGSSTYVGGICGYNNGSITNCYSTGKVSGGKYMGGICGYNGSGCSVTNCYNVGTVSGGSKYSGGICGYNSSSSSVSNCYNTGTVSGVGNAGGICGTNYSGSIENCYNVGNVMGNCIGGICGENNNGSIADCKFLIGTASGAVGTGSGTTSNVESFSSDSYKAEIEAALNTWVSDPANNPNGEYRDWMILTYYNYGYPIFAFVPEIENIDGTDYYVLYNAADMYWFANEVNSGNGSINARLGKDIILNNCDVNAAVAAGSTEGLVQWTPIGNDSNNFRGTFDGDGHTISGVYINSSKDYQGLFGYTGSGASIANVGVVNSYIKGGGSYVGGICGYNSSSGSISNSYNTGEVSSSSSSSAYAGGICGRNDGGSISNSYNTGAVSSSSSSSSSSSYTGGICGENYGGSIENSYNTGAVSSSSSDNNWSYSAYAYAGGICGSNSSSGSISNSYNTGAVSSSSGYVGGICGNNGGSSASIANCYNTGAVSGYYYVGGICGWNEGSIENSYNTGAVSSSYDYAYAGGICGYNYESSASIVNCYNTGAVSRSNYVGGICGHNSSGNIQKCRYTHQDDSIGAVGSNSGNVYVYDAFEFSSDTGNRADEIKDMLNVWVARNNSNDKYSYWKSDENNGYPVFDNNPNLVNVTWELGGSSVIERYVYGTIPEADVPDYCSNDKLYKFSGSFDKPIEAAEQDVTYKANYTEVAAPALNNDGYYWIENAYQLEWFSLWVNAGNSNANAKLKVNINLNPDYSFEFDEASGLVRVSYNNEAICAIGMNINGKSIHTDVAGVMGAVYTKDALTQNNLELADSQALNAVMNWTPIGNSSVNFSGKFDGDGHTVSGIYINSKSDYQGLFGCADYGASIANVNVTNSYIKGGSYVGGICGYNSGSNASIANCYNTGAVSGDSDVGGICGNNYFGSISDSYNTGAVSGRNAYVGGICGYNYGGSISNSYNTGAVSGGGSVGGICGDNYYGSINNSYNAGAVSGSGCVGGICGYNYYGSINNSYNTGAVSGSDNLVGGICGENWSGSIINSYNTGAVSSSSSSNYDAYAGGICGRNRGSISNSYNTGAVSSSYVGGICGENYGSSASIVNCYNTGMVSGSDAVGSICGSNSGNISNCKYLAGTSAEAIGSDSGTTSNVESFSSDNYKAEMETALNAWVSDPANNPNGEYRSWKIVSYYNDGYPVLVPQTEDIDGTAYYVLYNPADMYWFANEVNSGNNSINARLGNDIILNNCDVNAAVAAGSTERLMQWVPIGSYSNGFRGKFDGAGHTISGIYIMNTDQYYQGLFGYIGNDGCVSNVGVINLYININGEKGSSVGGICGSMYGRSASIVGCYSTGAISADSIVGGICGGIYGSSGSIVDCYSTSNVQGKNYVGGICGYNSNVNARILNCHSTGSVYGSSEYAGGICGINYGSVAGSYSTGTVSGNCYVGGICGYSGKGFASSSYSKESIANSYSTGTVSGYSYVGGICGYNCGSSASIAGCYSISTVSGREHFGGICGNNASRAAISDCKYLAQPGLNGIGYNYGGTITNVAAFSSESAPHLLADGSVDREELKDALNEWVDANGSADVSYSYWISDTEGVNNGYPLYVVSRNSDSYVVKWDIDGEIITEIYSYGDMPSFKYTEPEKAADEDYTYTFVGWTPEIGRVKWNTCYNALFSKKDIEYNIEIPENIPHGTVSTHEYTVGSNYPVTLTIKPDDGYKLSALTVKCGETEIETIGDENEITFIMPTGDVVVEALFEPENADDVTVDDLSEPENEEDHEKLDVPDKEPLEVPEKGYDIQQADGQEYANLTYAAHVEDYGWLDFVGEGETAGTVGEALRLEAVKIAIDSNLEGSIEYRTHVQDFDWQDFVRDGQVSGTEGAALRAEAIEIRLTGELAEEYSVKYRAHVQDEGWQSWRYDGEMAGTTGQSLRMEAIQIQLVDKIYRDVSCDGSNEAVPEVNYASVSYAAHIEDYGWLDFVDDGQVAGTEGQSLRLEGLKIVVDSNLEGSIEYRTHVQDLDWQDFVSNGAVSGTEGQALRAEAIEIRLTGELAEKYSVKYRAHVQDEGWQDWKYDGEMAGTTGQSLRMEAIEIILVEK